LLHYSHLKFENKLLHFDGPFQGHLIWACGMGDRAVAYNFRH